MKAIRFNIKLILHNLYTRSKTLPYDPDLAPCCSYTTDNTVFVLKILEEKGTTKKNKEHDTRQRKKLLKRDDI